MRDRWKKWVVAMTVMAWLVGVGGRIQAAESNRLVVPAGGYVELNFLFGYDSPHWVAVRCGGGGPICCTHDAQVVPRVDANGICTTAVVLYPSASPLILPASMVRDMICTALLPSVVLGETAE